MAGDVIPAATIQVATKYPARDAGRLFRGTYTIKHQANATMARLSVGRNGGPVGGGLSIENISRGWRHVRHPTWIWSFEHPEGDCLTLRACELDKFGGRG